MSLHQWLRWSRWLTYGAAIVVLFAGALAVRPEEPAVAKGGEPGQAVPIMESPRLPHAGADHAPYTTLPPTSGPHLAWTVAAGVFRDPIADELQVHALKRGHVLIQYAPGTPQAVVAELESSARRYAGDVLVAPYDGLDQGIALTAWGWIETLEALDADRIEAFVVAHAQ
jgi:hypothetical protein